MEDFHSFLSSIPSGLEAWTSWTKSSFASVRPKPNATDSSVSQRTANTLSLLNIVMPYSYPCAYHLSNVIGSVDDGHGDSCEALKTWINRKANIRNNLEIRTGKSLGEPTSDDPLWISSSKYPDVAWYRNEVFLQFEVVSNYNLEKTINKMCLGLVDQLRSWKNRRSSVYSVTGFVFPVYKSDKTVEACGRCVHRVDLCWNDSEFQYTVDVTPLESSQVWDNVIRVAGDQRTQLSNLPGTNNHFMLPMTEQYIKDNFGFRAMQVKSGESVVILDDEHAYKRILNSRAIHRLSCLKEMQISFSSYKACALPCSYYGSGFFAFERYNRPLTVDEITRSSSDKHAFITSVIKSLKVLHDEARIAHLDIRIENVCWDNDQRAVFVDLDRSEHVDCPAKECVGKYGKSLMYQLPKADWTAENVDYCQIAIMIGRIEGNVDPHVVPPNLAHPFMETLYVEGKLTLCLELSLTLLYVQVNMTKIYTNCGNQNEMPEVLLQSPKSLSNLVFVILFCSRDIFPYLKV